MLQILIEYLLHNTYYIIPCNSAQYVLNIYESLIITLRFTFKYIEYLNLNFNIN